MAILKLNSHEVLTQSGDNRPEFGASVPAGCMLNIESAWFNNQLTYDTADGSGHAIITASSGFSVIPSLTYVTMTAKQSNSKYWLNFTGNMSTTSDGTAGDWIGGFGFVVAPAGDTTWQHIGAGVNASYPNNIKYFTSRASVTGGGNDSFYMMQLAGNFLYYSGVSAGSTIRFAIEYFHYDNSSHNNLLINRTSINQQSNNPYDGGAATTFTVMEIAA